ncbi:MAG: AMP-binding protein [Chloroflexota bacterium]
MNIASWLHATALVQPDAPALLEGEQARATYREFAAGARAIAGGMSALHGVGPGQRVGLFMENRTEYLEALYGVWWLGAVAVPINYKLHPKEAAWIIENAGATVLLTGDGALSEAVALPAGCAEVGVGTPAWDALRTAGTGPDAPAALGNDALAWLFYTSGTTGRPKGVMLTHHNLAAMSTSYTLDVDEVSGADAALYAAPLSHGAGLYNFMHVRRGARHVVPRSHGFDPAEILDLGERVGGLSFFAAPTMLKRLVEEARRTGRTGEGIKTVVYGGGPMYLADIEEALAVMGPRFVQIYGQGESPMTITSLRREVLADSHHPRWRERLASVGTAQGCVEVRVVDEAMADLPPDTPGEVVVRGPTVMAGYWRNEQATRETLVDGWLRTGDVGRLDAEGFLTLTDRSKDVIISGGTNIYPREVEEVLVRHPAVSEAAVIGRFDRQWGESVVAFVVVAQGASCDERTLEAWCRGEMASFKKPKTYVFCESIPKNNYGKTLKTELRRLLAERDGTGSDPA